MITESEAADLLKYVDDEIRDIENTQRIDIEDCSWL
jgi:hypothetical protein